EEVEKQWQDFEDAYKETAQEVLGYKKKGQKPWISKESWELVEERKRLKNNIEQTKSDRIKQNYMDKYRCKDKEVKKSMRQDKRKWVDHLAMEAEEAAHNGRMKEVYDITKTLSNDKRKTTNAVKDKGGNLITEGLARRKRWKEHFEEILNRPIPDDPVTDVEIDPIINEISTDPITKAEIRTALRKMKNGKAGGKDEITAELLKADMNTTEKWLVKLFRTFWEQEKVPKTWKQGLIVKIPKSETWKINEGDNRKLDTFFFKCLRRILQIRWPYVVSNRDILAKTKLKTISTEVKLRRWKWVGHILRMEKNSNCETALTWTPEGRRKVGRPKTTWRSTIENERRILGWNSWNEARRVAADRTRWRRFTSALWATG
ncbi:hypothetical protein LSAT2_020211, partial [Lamellibrachia satsuma]